MKQIQETKKLLIFEDIKGKVTSVYRQNKEDDKNEKILIYKKNSKQIEYEFEGEEIKKLIILKTKKKILRLMKKFIKLDYHKL